MERKEYLFLCQRFSHGENVTIEYEGVKYNPVSYKLGFDKGDPKHTAVVRRGNCELEILLEKIKKSVDILT